MKDETKRKELLKLLSVGIAAYNRWDGLKLTLDKLVERGYQDVPVIVHDDGSKNLIDFDLDAYPMPIHFRRYEETQGCVKQRNAIMASAQTKYLLSIDDDSYPVAGDICDAIEAMEQDDDIAVMALDVRGPKDEHVVADSVGRPVDIRYFVLCGAMLRVDYYNAVGGFQNPDELGWIYNEELDYSIRCWRDGKKIQLDRRIIILHDREFKDGEDAFKSACYAKGLGYLHGRYFRGAFSLFKFLKMPFMMYRSPRTKPFWSKSVASFLSSYKVGVRHRDRDTNVFAAKDQWSWDKLDIPPFA